MSYENQLKQKLVSPDQAAKTVKTGDWVDYGGFIGQCVTFDKALAKRKDELKDVKIRACTRFQGAPEVVKADPQKEVFTYTNWHFSGGDRKLHDQGLCYYNPILYRDVPKYYRQDIDVDVVCVVVSPMDQHGFFNFGLQNSFTKATMDKAKTVIVEINTNMPRVLGGSEECIHISDVDYVIEGENPALVALPEGSVGELDQKIAEMIAAQLVDGSCIQLGIGGMPNAVGKLIARSDLKDLGVHTEMFVDAYVDMFEAGRVTNKRKNIDKGKMVFTFGAGSKNMYDFVNDNPLIASYPVDYTNKPSIISLNDNVVAINNCIEVDLFTQVCSESSGTRHISGTGGQFDFCEGAYWSKGGKAFLAFTSTFTNKQGELVSRIKPILTPGAIVTTTRTAIQYLVTEYGMVNMKGRSTWERAEALISIAHPQFQDELVRDAEKMGIWRKANKLDK
ncbi:MAG TPA: acetyl-CoA hydrolase/transferase C-terminal domain-containing protein [Bacillota bacterium]|nr:acetyl-CoA hydrolase/transferase C-terminal domain-containing protein [Bacillota bacterium]